MVRKPYERKIDKLSEDEARRTLNRSDRVKRAERQQINVKRFLDSDIQPFTGKEFPPSLKPMSRRANRRKPLKNNIRRYADHTQRFRSFNREVNERTAGGVRVDVSDDTNANEVYIQRTGARTTTDMVRYAPKTFHDRGIRDRRTAGGNILRGSRASMRDVRHSQRYISATEQAIIDRKVRNTLAESKLESEIKSVRDSSKIREDRLKVINDTKEKTIEQLNQKNIRQLHSHEVIAKSRLSATILGSDAEELNKILARGKKAGLNTIKDMIRKGELTSRAIIGQLDVSVGQKNSLGRILAQGSEWKEGEKYFFKDFDNAMNVRILNGILRGERGSNVEIELDDGSRVSVRKRAIVLPEEFTPPTINPQLPPQQTISETSPIAFSDGGASESSPQPRAKSFRAPSGETYGGGVGFAGGIPIMSEAEQQEARDNIYEGLFRGGGVIGGGGRGRSDEGGEGWLSGSTIRDDDRGEEEETQFFDPLPLPKEEKPDRDIARSNKLMKEIPTNEKLLKADELEFSNLENPPEGLFAGLSRTFSGNARREKELELIKMRIEGRRKKLIEMKKEANAIAVNKGLEIRYRESEIIEGTSSEGALLKRAKSNEPPVPQQQMVSVVREIEDREAVKKKKKKKEEVDVGTLRENVSPSVEDLKESPRPISISPIPEYKVIPLGGGGFITPDLTLEIESDEEEEELLRENRPSVVSVGDVELEGITDDESEEEPPEEDIADEAQQNLIETYSTMELTEDSRYAKFNWEGLPLLVDTQTNEIVDATGTIPLYSVRPFTSPDSVDFIMFPSDAEKQRYLKIAKEKVLSPSSRTTTPTPQTEDSYPSFSFSGRDNWVERNKMLDFGKNNELTELRGDIGLLVFSTEYGDSGKVNFKDQKRGAVRGVVMTKEQFMRANRNAGVSGRSLKKAGDKFTDFLRGDRGHFISNNGKLLEELGLTSSAGSIDYRGAIAGGLE